MEKEQSVEPRLPQGELHRVLRLAAVAHGLPDIHKNTLPDSLLSDASEAR